MIAIATSSLAYATAEPVVLATFDGSKTAHSWQVMNDPVMGGQSHSSFAQEGGVGNFTGLLSPPGFADASAFIGGSLYITAKSSTPSYKGFKVDFGAKNVTRPRPGMHHGPPSFKADFALPASAATDFATVKIPFSDFSVDWSDYTGECDTKDPTGEQHVCCSDAHPEVCPQAQHLATIQSIEVWAEGVEGEFGLEIKSIAAGP